MAEHLAATGYDMRYGARPLKRAIERQLVAPLAELLCRQVPRTADGLPCDCRGDAIAIDASAGPPKRRTGDRRTLDLLNDVTVLRRNVQRLERCEMVVRLRNDIESAASRRGSSA